METKNKPYEFSGKTFYFGVETKYGKDLEKNIKYIIGCSYQKTENNDFIVSLKRKQFFIDGIEPQKLVDKFANACMDVMYPIECRITKRGVFVEFTGFDDLRKRMQEGMPRIRQQYKGGQVNDYLQQIGSSLANKQTFSKALLNDPVYQLLFMDLSLRKKEEVVINFPVKAFKPSETFYGTTKKIEVKNNRVGVVFKGETFNNQSLEITRRLNNDDYSLQKVSAKTEDVLKQNAVYYIVTRLKEREQEGASFYEVKEDVEIEITPRKKKKKWLFF